MTFSVCASFRGCSCRPHLKHVTKHSRVVLMPSINTLDIVNKRVYQFSFTWSSDIIFIKQYEIWSGFWGMCICSSLNHHYFALHYVLIIQLSINILLWQFLGAIWQFIFVSCYASIWYNVIKTSLADITSTHNFITFKYKYQYLHQITYFCSASE